MLYAIFANVCKDEYGVEVVCFGIFDNKEAAERIVDNIVKDEDIDRDEIAIEAFELNKQANVFIDSYYE